LWVLEHEEEVSMANKDANQLHHTTNNQKQNKKLKMVIKQILLWYGTAAWNSSC
jgi:hypothetical protein